LRTIAEKDLGEVSGLFRIEIAVKLQAELPVHRPANPFDGDAEGRGNVGRGKRISGGVFFPGRGILA
jgi:hypothetical protein